MIAPIRGGGRAGSAAHSGPDTRRCGASPRGGQTCSGCGGVSSCTRHIGRRRPPCVCEGMRISPLVEGLSDPFGVAGDRQRPDHRQEARERPRADVSGVSPSGQSQTDRRRYPKLHRCGRMPAIRSSLNRVRFDFCPLRGGVFQGSGRPIHAIRLLASRPPGRNLLGIQPTLPAVLRNHDLVTGSMVEQQGPELATRGRFPSPAPADATLPRFGSHGSVGHR